MATISKDVPITVVGSSAKEMLCEIEKNKFSEERRKFILSLKEKAKEFEEWKKAGGS